MMQLDRETEGSPSNERALEPTLFDLSQPDRGGETVVRDPRIGQRTLAPN